MSKLETVDWTEIPAPEDDGAARHLVGTAMPALSLPATDGETVDLSRIEGRVVVYAYPRTGEPDKGVPDGWNQIPGARGCTPQSCSFRDHFRELMGHGVTSVYGLSSQDSAYQREAVERLRLPFPLLSDAELRLAEALNLPTFAFEGATLLKRLTLIIRDGTIEHVMYPVFPPDRSASDVLAWLENNPG